MASMCSMQAATSVGLGKAFVNCLEPYNSVLVQTYASCFFALAVLCMLSIEHGSPDGEALTSWLTNM